MSGGTGRQRTFNSNELVNIVLALFLALSVVYSVTTVTTGLGLFDRPGISPASPQAPAPPIKMDPDSLAGIS